MEQKYTKFIFETTVKKEVETMVKTTREEGGKTVEISTPTKTLKDIKIAILKPDRKRLKEGEVFYAVTLSSYLKKGLLPYSLVSKRYLDDGGPMTENEKKAVMAMRDKYALLQEEYYKMTTPLGEEDKKRSAAIALEMTDINTLLKQIQSNYSSLFDNTAEAKTRNDTMEFWVLNASLIDEDGTGYRLFYGEGDYDSKVKMLEEYQDKEDPFILEVINKLSYFICFWYAATTQTGQVLTKEDFQKSEVEYNENVTKYLKSVKETPITETPAVDGKPS